MSYRDFFLAIDRANLDLQEPVKIVAHFDADGICSASIVAYFLKLQGKGFSIDFVPVLTDSCIDSLEDEGTHLFVDVGSSAIDRISQALPDSEKIVLDHHEVVGKAGFVHMNPELYGLDSGSEVSGAGVVYLFFKRFDNRVRDVAHLAVIGAIGDYQINGALSKLNNDIINEAVSEGLIVQSRGLRILKNKSLLKYLSTCQEPYIPGVSGDAESARAFLEKAGIPVMRHGREVTLSDLDDAQKRRLTDAILKKRAGEEHPDDIFGVSFRIVGEDEFSCAYDFATLLNACGRMGEGMLGVDVALGKPGSVSKAKEVLHEYRRKLHAALDWYTRNSDSFIHGKDFVIVDASDVIMPSMIGTISSMISRSFNLAPGTVVAILGDCDDRIKVSLRAVAPSSRNVLDILKDAGVKGMLGGHKAAAGATTSREDKEDFIRRLKLRLEREAGA